MIRYEQSKFLYAIFQVYLIPTCTDLHVEVVPVSHEELAYLMKDLGCVQAYNLDGGNTAEMIMIGPDADHVMFHVKGDQTASEYRSQSDIIYFATAVPESERD